MWFSGFWSSRLPSEQSILLSVLGGFLVQRLQFFHNCPLKQFQRPENHQIRFPAVLAALGTSLCLSFFSIAVVEYLEKRNVKEEAHS